MGLTDAQMEFLVISKAIEVRENKTLEVVDKNFNPSKHHVVPWAVQNWKGLQASESQNTI
jgi:hypothetical protein